MIDFIMYFLFAVVPITLALLIILEAVYKVFSEKDNMSNTDSTKTCG